MAAVTCCILSRSACSSLCALWGDTFSVGSSDVHRYYVKLREVGDTKNLCDPGSPASVCMLGCMIPLNKRRYFLAASGKVYWVDSSSTFQCSSIENCCLTKLLCDFTIFYIFFIPLAFLYLPHFLLSLLFLSSLHCWRCSTLCLRRDTSPSVTHQKRAFIRYTQVCRVVCSCYICPLVSAAPTGRSLKCSFIEAAGRSHVAVDREALVQSAGGRGGLWWKCSCRILNTKSHKKLTVPGV